MASDYNYRFTDKAVNDFDEILTYIKDELNNKKAAKDFYNEVFKRIDNVCRFPKSGALIENEYIPDKTIRRFLVENYTVYYKCDEETSTIYIIRLIYSRRNLEEIIKTLEQN